MKFPEGRVYTIQLTADELLLLWGVAASLDIEDSLAQDLYQKIDAAHMQRCQDIAMRSLLDVQVDRGKWLDEQIAKLLKEQKNVDSGSKT